MATYGIKTETTTHIKGLAIGDNYKGAFTLDVPTDSIGILETKKIMDESQSASSLIERIVLLDTDEPFIKLTISVMTAENIFYNHQEYNRYNIYSIPFIPNICAMMAADGYISDDKALILSDATGYHISNAKAIEKIKKAMSMETDKGFIGVLPVNINRALLLSKDLLPYAFPLIGLYDDNMGFDEFITEMSAKESLVSWGGLYEDIPFNMIMDKMNHESIIELSKTYYEYLQWKEKEKNP